MNFVPSQSFMLTQLLALATSIETLLGSTGLKGKLVTIFSRVNIKAKAKIYERRFK